MLGLLFYSATKINVCKTFLSYKMLNIILIIVQFLFSTPAGEQKNLFPLINNELLLSTGYWLHCAFGPSPKCLHNSWQPPTIAWSTQNSLFSKLHLIYTVRICGVSRFWSPNWQQMSNVFFNMQTQLFSMWVFHWLRNTVYIYELRIQKNTLDGDIWSIEIHKRRPTTVSSLYTNNQRLHIGAAFVTLASPPRIKST